MPITIKVSNAFSLSKNNEYNQNDDVDVFIDDLLKSKKLNDFAELIAEKAINKIITLNGTRLRELINKNNYEMDQLYENKAHKEFMTTKKFNLKYKEIIKNYQQKESDNQFKDNNKEEEKFNDYTRSITELKEETEELVENNSGDMSKNRFNVVSHSEMENKQTKNDENNSKGDYNSNLAKYMPVTKETGSFSDESVDFSDKDDSALDLGITEETDLETETTESPISTTPFGRKRNRYKLAGSEAFLSTTLPRVIRERAEQEMDFNVIKYRTENKANEGKKLTDSSNKSYENKEIEVQIDINNKDNGKLMTSGEDSNNNNKITRSDQNINENELNRSEYLSKSNEKSNKQYDTNDDHIKHVNRDEGIINNNDATSINSNSKNINDDEQQNEKKNDKKNTKYHIEDGKVYVYEKSPSYEDFNEMIVKRKKSISESSGNDELESII